MLRSLGFVDYLLTYVDVIIDIVFQRIKLWGVPKMQQIEGARETQNSNSVFNFVFPSLSRLFLNLTEAPTKHVPIYY